MTKLNFLHVHFQCDSCAILRGHMIAARLLQDMQGVCMTNIRALTNVFGL